MGERAHHRDSPCLFIGGIAVVIQLIFIHSLYLCHMVDKRYFT